MSDDPRVSQLLDELLASHATPEDVCRASPELLPEVRARWRQVCRVRAELDGLFPTRPEPDARASGAPHDGTALPRIPGYEVEAVLGRGGMGVVFRARHLRLGRVVALKMLLADAYAGPQERERFQREAEAVAALRHPNVVQIYDVGESNGRPYFTMEFIDGGSLAQKLAGTPQPPRGAAALLAVVAGAVHAAHTGGIVHRDLKPANVLLTIDGTPKISDFGLARRLDDEAALTRTGAVVGTPSYMAPEQAQGKGHAVGVATDVYALGAMLYELLTGRPPFRAGTEAETLHQVISQEPVPPSRLNGSVPRDLETICLKCLRKEPHLRYATAAALADDLHRFLRGEAITARPERRLARLVRRVRRRPALSAAVAACALLLGVVLGGGVWVLSDRKADKRAREAAEAATEQAAEQDVDDMVQWLRKSSWPEARAALERAKGRLGDRGSVGLRQRMGQGERDLELALRFEALGLGAAGDGAGNNPAEFEATFRAAGLGRFDESPEVVAARLRASDIREALLLALDQWPLYVRDDSLNRPRMKWLVKTALLTDPDRSGWRALAGDLTNLNDEAVLKQLVETAPRPFPSLPVLHAVRLRLSSQNKDPVPFLVQIQQAHPEDYWVNYQLGSVLIDRNPREALRYLQAALTLRPNAVNVNRQIGNALLLLGRLDEAVAAYRRVEELDPTGSTNTATLTDLLSRLGRHDETEARLRRHALSPRTMNTRVALRSFLVQRGRGEEALLEWRTAIEAHPADYNACHGHAALCLFLGREEEYRSARRSLLARFGQTADPVVAARTCWACLLRPAEPEELRQAVALAERGMAADRRRYQTDDDLFQFAQALAEYRRGEFARAVSLLQRKESRALGPVPRLVLAMSLQRNGKGAEARKVLAEAVRSHDWRVDQVRGPDDWPAHVLRREAEGLILPDLSAFLTGAYQPRDNDERLALLGACQATNRPLALANLYTDTFAADPRLADDPGTGHRYGAARAAALVGSGRGADATGLGEPEKRRWREQALRWLRADLDAWDKASGASPDGRFRARQALTAWRWDPDLAGLRDPSELGKLSPDERRACRALWAEVEDVVERTVVAGPKPPGR